MRLAAEMFEGAISIGGMNVRFKARLFVLDGKIVGVRSLRLVGTDGADLPKFDDGTIEAAKVGWSSRADR